MLADRGLERLPRDVRDGWHADLAVAGDQGDNARLVIAHRTAAELATADVRLVDLDLALEQTGRWFALHRLADSVGQVPRGLVRVQS
jgi:hypothetical protein